MIGGFEKTSSLFMTGKRKLESAHLIQRPIAHLQLNRTRIQHDFVFAFFIREGVVTTHFVRR